MKSIQEVLGIKSKKLFCDYARDINKRLIKGLKKLGQNDYSIEITRQIFWNICLTQPIKNWEGELRLAILFEAKNSHIDDIRASRALKIAGCDDRVSPNFAEELNI
ncbi:MAG: hypothetical protein WA087_00450 [Candidatus Saccharimonadales bacterium]